MLYDQVPWNSLRAGPGGEDFDSAADASVFRGVRADQQLDLAERLRRWRVEDRAARFRNHVAGAVDQLFARASRGSRDARLAALFTPAM